MKPDLHVSSPPFSTFPCEFGVEFLFFVMCVFPPCLGVICAIG